MNCDLCKICSKLLLNDIVIPTCHHLIHSDCINKLLNKDKWSCPTCGENFSSLLDDSFSKDIDLTKIKPNMIMKQFDRCIIDHYRSVFKIYNAIKNSEYVKLCKLIYIPSYIFVELVKSQEFAIIDLFDFKIDENVFNIYFIELCLYYKYAKDKNTQACKYIDKHINMKIFFECCKLSEGDLKYAKYFHKYCHSLDRYNENITTYLTDLINHGQFEQNEYNIHSIVTALSYVDDLKIYSTLMNKIKTENDKQILNDYAKTDDQFAIMMEIASTEQLDIVTKHCKMFYKNMRKEYASAFIKQCDRGNYDHILYYLSIIGLNSSGNEKCEVLQNIEKVQISAYVLQQLVINKKSIKPFYVDVTPYELVVLVDSIGLDICKTLFTIDQLLSFSRQSESNIKYDLAYKFHLFDTGLLNDLILIMPEEMFKYRVYKKYPLINSMYDNTLIKDALQEIKQETKNELLIDIKKMMQKSNLESEKIEKQSVTTIEDFDRLVQQEFDKKMKF